ncbi:MAG: MFS transporter [Spongiibacteraceae bacterium]|jgi:PPP family 3-phenylpropionic acid transporter|nr:MFS transporter [Spongiibacteraceae bacterium]
MPYWRLSAFYLFYFALHGAWMPFWPLYLGDLGFGATAIGYLTGAVMATKIVAPNLWGWLADRSGHRMAIIRSGSLLALLIFLMVFVDQSFWWLMAVVTGFSFFWNAVLAQFEVVTLSHLHGQYPRYSRVRLWGSVGFIAVVVGLGWLFDQVSVRLLPWVMAALLAGIWLSTLTVDERSGFAARSAPRRAVVQILREPGVVAFFWVCCLLQISHGPYYTFFSVWLEMHDYSRTATGLLWSLGVFAEIAVFMAMHRLMQRASLRAIVLASLALSALRWLLIAWFVDLLWVLLIAQTLHAASFGAFHAFAVEFVRRRFYGREGQGMALYSGLSFGAGGALGAVGSGWLWDAAPRFSFELASLAALLALVIAAIALRRSALVGASVGGKAEIGAAE